jgi:hypothetical protein
MDHKRFLIREKIQIWLSVLVLLALSYWGVWRFFMPADPQSPMLLLDGRLIVLGVLLGAAAVIATLGTLGTRPTSTVMVSVLGLAGLAMRSPDAAMLDWQWGDRVSRLYLLLLVEVLLLGVAVLGTMALVGLLRYGLGRVIGRARWVDPLEAIDEEDRQMLIQADVPVSKLSWLSDHSAELYVLHAGQQALARLVGVETVKGEVLLPKDLKWQNLLGCLGGGTFLGVVLVALFAQSDDRGQVLFSCLGGMMLANLAASHYFSVQSSLIPLGVTMVTAAVFYLVAAVTGQADRPCFHILPIDWMTFGVGGALLGYWTAARMRETRVYDTLVQLWES